MPLAVANLVARPAPIPVAVTPDVHPVPAPALPITRTGEQLGHNLVIGIGRLIGKKCAQFIACGRQADEVEVDAPQQNRPGRRRIGGEAVFSALGIKEMVNGIAQGRFGVERGNRWPLDGLERPVIPGIGLRLLVQRGGQSRGNPLAQGGNFRGLQGLALRRHTLLKILAGDARE